MKLIETVAWALVELQSPRPDVPGVRNALERALVEAAKVSAERDAAAHSLIRITKTLGA